MANQIIVSGNRTSNKKLFQLIGCWAIISVFLLKSKKLLSLTEKFRSFTLPPSFGKWREQCLHSTGCVRKAWNHQHKWFLLLRRHSMGAWGHKGTAGLCFKRVEVTTVQMKAVTIFEVTSKCPGLGPVSLLDIWKAGEEHNGKSCKWHEVVNLGKVHESCEKLERHLPKLGNSLNGMLPAVGYLQPEKVQREGLGEERKERMKGVEKLSWRETEKIRTVYLKRRDEEHVKEIKNIYPSITQWNIVLTFLFLRWNIVILFCLKNWSQSFSMPCSAKPM